MSSQLTDQQLRVRVGLFVIVSVILGAGMVLQFGKLESLWRKQYTIAIHFDAATGIHQSSKVRMNGIPIGEVRRVEMDEKRGGVNVIARIDEQFRIREDSQAQIMKGLLGDAAIEISMGSSQKLIEPGSLLDGSVPMSTADMVRRMEAQMSVTMESFTQTGKEWQLVGRNLNGLLQTNHGTINEVLERTAESLTEFTDTMKTANQTLSQANKVLGNPKHQEALTKTLSALPELVDETRATVLAVRNAVVKVDKNLSHLNDATQPLAEKSASIVNKLDASLGNMEEITSNLSGFSELVATKDGSLKRLVSDPTLYRNLNASAESLALLLRNLEPTIRDLRIFSDKVARHPELIGLSGAIKGSSGVKEPAAPRAANSRTGIRRN